jgi:shikimate kinase
LLDFLGMNPSHNLFLVGPMGAGKSTVGRKLAARFGLHFVDLDHEIEAATGASVSLIFEIEGEQQFREREMKLLDDISCTKGLLLATGGGAIINPVNREHLRNRGFVLYLKTDVDTQLDRLSRDRQRPLLQTADPRAKLVQLAEQRNHWYEQIADLVWPSHQQTPKTAAEQLVQVLREHWQQLPENSIYADVNSEL